MTKKKVLATVKRFSLYDFDSKVVDLIKEFQDLVDEYGDEVRIEYMDEEFFDVTAQRLETDFEYEHRKKQEKRNRKINAKRKKEKEENDRKLYEKLKLQFET